MAWTSFLRTAQLRLTVSALPRAAVTRRTTSRAQRLLGIRNPSVSSPRELHTSSSRLLRPSQAPKVRNHYPNGGHGRGSGNPTVMQRVWAAVDRIGGKTLVYGIIAVDVVIYGIFQVAQGPETPHVRQWLRDNMMSSWYNIKHGRVWTLVTSAFAHASSEHLLFNMLGLWMFCPSVASSVGSAIFLQVYLAGSIGCDLFSLFWNRNADQRRGSLGASGALCSIMSFTACLVPKSTVHLYGVIPMPLWGCVVGIFLYDLYGSQRRSSTSTTDFAGHIGGTLTGVGLFFLKSRLGVRGI